nr:putative dual specificity protein phosphatase DSP8 [Tanacetum cinerariifolium]
MKIEEDLDNQMKMMSNNYNEFIGGDDDYKRVLVGAGARILFYPTLFYNVCRNKMQSEFRWWDQIDEYLLLGAVPFPKDVPRLKELGVGGVITLNEPYETLVPTSLYRAHDIDHLIIPTRDYLFAPSFYDIDRAVEFIHRNVTSGKTTYVHCKAGRGRSTTIVLCYLVEYRHMTPDSALEYIEEDLDNQMKKMSNNYNEFIGDDDDYKRVLVGAGARILFYPTLFYNVCRNKLQYEFRWHMTPDSALEYVRSRRPRVLLAPSQWKAVHEFKDWRLASTDPPSPSRDAVLITKADLEGYNSPSHSKELAIVSGSARTKPMIAKLSCLFTSLKCK